MKLTTKKILIVEDEEPISHVLKEKFGLVKGLNAIIAKDGDEGLKMALKEKPDLILLDIILPRMNGIEMLKTLRRDGWGKEAKVIILSNLSNPEKEKEAKDLGVLHYIIKVDWEIEDVINLVRSAL